MVLSLKAQFSFRHLFKPCCITFTDVKCQAPNRGAGGAAELLRCFTQTCPALTTNWKPDVIFPHPDNLNFSPLHKKSKYKGVFPRAGLSLVKKIIISTLCHNQLSSFCVLTFSWRSGPWKSDIIPCKKQLDPFLDYFWVSWQNRGFTELVLSIFYPLGTHKNMKIKEPKKKYFSYKAHRWQDKGFMDSTNISKGLESGEGSNRLQNQVVCYFMQRGIGVVGAGDTGKEVQDWK